MDSMTKPKIQDWIFILKKAIIIHFNAHRLLHLAKKHNLSDALEELF
jgi:hypothetical protein